MNWVILTDSLSRTRKSHRLSVPLTSDALVPYNYFLSNVGSIPQYVQHTRV